MNKNFGEVLRAIRESRMLSQKELAQKANIDPSHLNKIEKGIRMPSDEVLFRLADVLVAEELFQAAGRVIPPEFEKKYPPKKTKICEWIEKQEVFKKTIPEPLRKLLPVYQSQYNTISDKILKIEDNIRAMERIVSSNTDLYVSLKKQTNESKYQDLIDIADLIISIDYNIVGELWELESASFEEGIIAGKILAIYDIWKEINKTIEKDMVSFIAEFLKIDRDDAELVAEIINVIKRRKPSNQ